MKYSAAFEEWYKQKRPIWCDEYCADEGKKLMWAAWQAGMQATPICGDCKNWQPVSDYYGYCFVDRNLKGKTDKCSTQ